MLWHGHVDHGQGEVQVERVAGNYAGGKRGASGGSMKTKIGLTTLLTIVFLVLLNSAHNVLEQMAERI